MGWNLTVTVPWKNALGLAVSESPGAPFRRVSRFPIMPLDEIDPYTISYPWVTRDNDRYRMWYGSNLRWGPEKKDMLHVIKYAESSDAVHREKQDRIAIDSAFPDENAICKPCVVKDADCYRGSAAEVRSTAFSMLCPRTDLPGRDGDEMRALTCRPLVGTRI
jgi:hypothetical protein